MKILIHIYCPAICTNPKLLWVDQRYKNSLNVFSCKDSKTAMATVWYEGVEVEIESLTPNGVDTQLYISNQVLIYSQFVLLQLSEPKMHILRDFIYPTCFQQCWSTEYGIFYDKFTTVQQVLFSMYRSWRNDKEHCESITFLRYVGCLFFLHNTWNLSDSVHFNPELLTFWGLVLGRDVTTLLKLHQFWCLASLSSRDQK